MARVSLQERLKQGVFLLDGAMGTELMAAGVESGRCNECVNVESPGIVEGIHRRYLKAGSDAVITNSFGANAVSLRRHGFAERVLELTEAAARVARKAAGEDRYVLGDIGPCGDFLEPLGTLTVDSLRQAFADQARGLGEGGVDGYIIETMMALDEMVVAIEGVRSVSDLPILCSFAYDSAGGGFRTMMGIDPAAAFNRIGSLGIAAIGYNCGTLTMDQYVGLTEEYARLIDGWDGLLLAEPNAGKPILEEGQAIYKLSPEEYGQAARRIRDAGARIMGGCCGTTPEHIAALSRQVKGG